MLETAKILPFPSTRRSVEKSVEDALSTAEELLSIDLHSRSDSDLEVLADADVAQNVLESLKRIANSDPVRVSAEAEAVHASLSKLPLPVGLFDEKDYYLGEFALLAGQAFRLLGQFENAERWLDISEGSFCHTLNSPPSILRVAHARLAVRYDMRRFPEVLALLPSVTAGYERLGMTEDLLKARFLEASTLKETGETSAAFDCFSRLLEKLTPSETLRPLVLTHLGEEHARRGDHQLALDTYQQALSSIAPTGPSLASAHLKASIGATFRTTGQLGPATECLRAAIAEFSTLGMTAKVASGRIVLAEVLLAASRVREAEWEILAALPVIKEQRMVAEGFAATELLKETVRRRQTDTSALRDLSSPLQAR
ncbi:MAG: hypothetical protein ABR610_07755 [Thermoanaerobaculia bacterium]